MSPYRLVERLRRQRRLVARIVTRHPLLRRTEIAARYRPWLTGEDVPLRDAESWNFENEFAIAAVDLAADDPLFDEDEGAFAELPFAAAPEPAEPPAQTGMRPTSRTSAAQPTPLASALPATLPSQPAPPTLIPAITERLSAANPLAVDMPRSETPSGGEAPPSSGGTPPLTPVIPPRQQPAANTTQIAANPSALVTPESLVANQSIPTTPEQSVTNPVAAAPETPTARTLPPRRRPPTVYTSTDALIEDPKEREARRTQMSQVVPSTSVAPVTPTLATETTGSSTETINNVEAAPVVPDSSLFASQAPNDVVAAPTLQTALSTPAGDTAPNEQTPTQFVDVSGQIAGTTAQDQPNQGSYESSAGQSSSDIAGIESSMVLNQAAAVQNAPTMVQEATPPVQLASDQLLVATPEPQTTPPTTPSGRGKRRAATEPSMSELRAEPPAATDAPEQQTESQDSGVDPVPNTIQVAAPNTVAPSEVANTDPAAMRVPRAAELLAAATAVPPNTTSEALVAQPRRVEPSTPPATQAQESQPARTTSALPTPAAAMPNAVAQAESQQRVLPVDLRAEQAITGSADRIAPVSPTAATPVATPTEAVPEVVRFVAAIADPVIDPVANTVDFVQPASSVMPLIPDLNDAPLPTFAEPAAEPSLASDVQATESNPVSGSAATPDELLAQAGTFSGVPTEAVTTSEAPQPPAKTATTSELPPVVERPGGRRSRFEEVGRASAQQVTNRRKVVEPVAPKQTAHDIFNRPKEERPAIDWGRKLFEATGPQPATPAQQATNQPTTAAVQQNEGPASERTALDWGRKLFEATNAPPLPPGQPTSVGLNRENVPATPAPPTQPVPPTPTNQPSAPPARRVAARRVSAVQPSKPSESVADQRTPTILSEPARRFLRPIVGIDPADVRVFRDAAAAETTAQLGADAATVGEDVLLGTGNADDTSPETLGLLAHELTHVAQRREARFVPPVARADIAAGGDEEALARSVEQRTIEAAQSFFSQPSTETTGRSGSVFQPMPSDSSDPWNGLPAPWEPLPSWFTGEPAAPRETPRPALQSVPTLTPTNQPAAAPMSSPGIPGSATLPSFGAAPPVALAAIDRATTDDAPAAPSAASADPQKAPEPDVDALARQVYAVLKQRLAAERRRLG